MLSKIKIGREAFDKIMYYVNKTNFEISGLGNVQVIDGVPTVTDIILLKQENSSAETEMDADAIAKAVYDHHVSGMEGELKFWWHSHVNMDVFWSGTDTKTIEDLTTQGWFIHGVFNKRDEYRCAYSNNDPVPVFIDNLDLEIDEELITNPEYKELQEELAIIKEDILEKISEECDAKFDELVTDRSYTYNNHWNNWRQRGNFAMGKQITPVKEIIQSDLTMNFSGGEYMDIEGAAELLMMGFTETEIKYMEKNYFIFDGEDLYYQGEDIVRKMLKEDIGTIDIA